MYNAESAVTPADVTLAGNRPLAFVVKLPETAWLGVGTKAMLMSPVPEKVPPTLSAVIWAVPSSSPPELNAVKPRPYGPLKENGLAACG